KKYKLPPLIQRAIQTHHGTDFISFFYALAEKEKPEGAPMPAEKDFRYDGPLPTDREVMLIVLADCCEAAVQSIEEPTVEKVESMVNSLFEKKLKSGQLEESPLTIRELHTIRKAFVESLVSMHNKRIAYPDQDEKTARKDENA
ncbi:MAG: phosphohydrolase, partial [Lentisphaeria bacterium]|nr:phosphohydrolase [Lentisphaeria bacterium]